MENFLYEYFNNPLILLLITFIPLILWIYLKKIKRPFIKFSNIDNLKDIKKSKNLYLINLIPFLRCLAILLFIIALARPHLGKENKRIITKGIDIVLAIDVSGSMLAEDFEINGKRVNRLEAAKEVIKRFIKNRKGDRIGLVVFAGRAYTQCPLTLDYEVLLNFLKYIKIGMIDDGTAIGNAIAISLMRLKNSKAKSKVIILLTDGRNNSGNIPPQTAAQTSKALGIKIYTIGIGTKGFAPYPAKDFFGRKIYIKQRVDIDEELLTNIAKMTGGRYFRAQDTESLKETYKEIDKMEKIKIKSIKYLEYIEHFHYFLLAGLIIFLIEIILSYTYLKIYP